MLLLKMLEMTERITVMFLNVDQIDVLENDNENDNVVTENVGNDHENNSNVVLNVDQIDFLENDNENDNDNVVTENVGNVRENNSNVVLNVDQIDVLENDYRTVVTNESDEECDNSIIASRDIKISMLNVNGWTSQNKVLREGIVRHLKSDIFCINETHFRNANLNVDGEFGNYLDKVEMQNYTWIGNNRKHTNQRAPKPSGGVGVLVRDSLLDVYSVKVVDKDFDGVLALLFEDKETNYSFMCICTYLPPENSVWGRNAFMFYNHLLQLVYTFSDVDALCICGDLNSRIGGMSDYNVDLDNIPARVPLDKTKNLHGEALIDFLLDAKMCVLNGRLNSQCDEHTVVNSRGKSVVDYMIVPHDVLNMCKSFEVLNCEKLVDDANLVHLISERCKIPDHAVLSMKLNIYVSEQVSNACTASITKQQECKENRRYKLNLVPPDFSLSQNCQTALVKVIEKLERELACKQELDSLYRDVCKVIIDEMNDVIPFKEVDLGREKKKFKSYKPYWTQELSEQWKAMVISKRAF